MRARHGLCRRSRWPGLLPLVGWIRVSGALHQLRLLGLPLRHELRRPEPPWLLQRAGNPRLSALESLYAWARRVGRLRPSRCWRRVPRQRHGGHALRSVQPRGRERRCVGALSPWLGLPAGDPGRWQRARWWVLLRALRRPKIRRLPGRRALRTAEHGCVWVVPAWTCLRARRRHLPRRDGLRARCGEPLERRLPAGGERRRGLGRGLSSRERRCPGVNLQRRCLRSGGRRREVRRALRSGGWRAALLCSADVYRAQSRRCVGGAWGLSLTAAPRGQAFVPLGESWSRDCLTRVPS